MGWRYQLIVIGAITLGIFVLRFFVFNFRESPKFLLSKGREEEAIEVLHSIAKFNRTSPPNLTMGDFQAVNQEMSVASDPENPLVGGVRPQKLTERSTAVMKGSVRKLSHLRGLFSNKLAAWSFGVLFIAYISVSIHVSDLR